MKTFIAAVMSIAALAAPGWAQTHPEGHVIANGGNTSSGSGLVVHATVGQAAIGVSSSAVRRLGHGFWGIGGTRAASVEPGPDPLPIELSVGHPFPNPSRDAVRFAVALPEPARVRLAVYDVSGRRVGGAIEERLDAGVHEMQWRAPGGRAGVLFARLFVDGRLEGERRIVLVR